MRRRALRRRFREDLRAPLDSVYRLGGGEAAREWLARNAMGCKVPCPCRSEKRVRIPSDVLLEQLSGAGILHTPCQLCFDRGWATGLAIYLPGAIFGLTIKEVISA